ncbi:Tubulointerstitial nephritis antigen-like [Homalodisca vitripennis]|nr:Tubulointerstitial nephritis antigen-like [Homalodisca vitripennis]
MIGCSKCQQVCRGGGCKHEMVCSQNKCLVDPELLTSINQDRFAGYKVANYTEFWGRTLNEGMARRLGTLHSRRRTTLEVLEAENQCMRLQIGKRDCSEPCTEVKSRKTSKVAVRKKSRDQLREEIISIDSKQKQHNKRKNSNS